MAELEERGNVTLSLPDGPVVLDANDLQVRLQAKEGWAAAQGHCSVVVLSTELSEELVREGLARELVRTIQDRRKDMDCQFTDRIALGIVTESEDLRAAIEQFRDYIMGETLAVSFSLGPIAGVEFGENEGGRLRGVAVCQSASLRMDRRIISVFVTLPTANAFTERWECE